MTSFVMDIHRQYTFSGMMRVRFLRNAADFKRVVSTLWIYPILRNLDVGFRMVAVNNFDEGKNISFNLEFISKVPFRLHIL